MNSTTTTAAGSASGEMQQQQPKVHFESCEENDSAHANDIVVKYSAGGGGGGGGGSSTIVNVHLGFLQIFHVYEVRFPVSRKALAEISGNGASSSVGPKETGTESLSSVEEEGSITATTTFRPLTPTVPNLNCRLINIVADSVKPVNPPAADSESRGSSPIKEKTSDAIMTSQKEEESNDDVITFEVELKAMKAKLMKESFEIVLEKAAPTSLTEKPVDADNQSSSISDGGTGSGVGIAAAGGGGRRTQTIKIVLHARVLGKGKGTPMLKNGIRCTGSIPDPDESDINSDWQGFS